MFGRKRQAQREAEAKAQAVADLRAAVVDLLVVAEGGTKDPPEPTGWSLVLKPGERLVYPMTGVGLFEPRRARALVGPLCWVLGTGHRWHPVPHWQIRRYLCTRQ